MLKKIFTSTIIVLNTFIYAQIGVGISNPHSSAMLEISSTNKGFLPPRIELKSFTDGTTIPNPAKGLIVYNTNTSFVDEGLYLNIGTEISPNWRILQPRLNEETVEFSKITIDPARDMNAYQHGSHFLEVPNLRQHINVSLGAKINIIYMASLYSQSGTYQPLNGAVPPTSQVDILITIEPVQLADVVSYTNPRTLFAAIYQDGFPQVRAVNFSKTVIATNTSYWIQIYYRRLGSSGNPSGGFYFQSASLNTLVSK
ncbi:hypothetical protein [Chryseobacterium mucoviscidosis]|uniref:hypothetical protein n=1 Tax=Chryseobacterium mucoviscidosis TaxID=1945581 RepID=UPI0031D44335